MINTAEEVIQLLSWCRDNRVFKISVEGLEAELYPVTSPDTDPEELQNILNERSSVSRKDMEEILYHSAGD